MKILVEREDLEALFISLGRNDYRIHICEDLRRKLEKILVESPVVTEDKSNEKHDDSQIPVRSKEKNIQAIKDAIANHTNNVTNREAIIEILGMLAEHRRYDNELSYTIGCKAEELKAKLVGEK